MEIYTVEEVSMKLKLPEETIRQHLRKGLLKGAKIGKHWRITDEQLKEYLDAHTKKEG